MAKRDIAGDIAFLWVKAKSISAHEPVFALLLCRQIGEAILMKKHIEMLPEGVEPKTILTLGDLDNQKLNMKQYFTAIQIASLRYIQDMTNPFVHYRIDEQKVPNKRHVERLLEQVEEFMEPTSKNLKTEIANFSISEVISGMGADMDLGGRRKRVKQSQLSWKEVLVYELEQFEWPKLSDTVLGSNHIGLHKGRYSRKINTAKDRLEAAKDVEDNKAERDKIKRFQKNKIPLDNIGKMSPEMRMDIIKSATEAILIAYYSRFGGPKYEHKEINGYFVRVALDGVFKQHIESNFANANSRKYKKYWEFLFARDSSKNCTNGDILFKNDWKFMYFS